MPTPEGVRRKTEYLIREEGRDPEQAYAMAWNMYRRGRLTKRGKYRRVQRRRSRRK